MRYLTPSPLRHLPLSSPQGFGPVTEAPEDTAHNLHKALDSEWSMAQRGMQPKSYATFAHAVDARIRAVSFYPGTQSLSPEAAALLVARGARRLEQGQAEKGGEYADLGEVSEGPVCFRHDKRLVLPSYMYHSEEQVMSYVHALTSKTLLVTGSKSPALPCEMIY
ncbi:hypothetical protein EON64_09545 [archaeon]|nr:MAG: hypothetical protein EON64_09545 [archaeon]